MACMTMSTAQQSRPLRRPVRVAWPSALLSGLQRAGVAVFVVGALALASAALLTVSSAHTPGPEVQRVELPPVVVHGRRLPPAARAASSACPLPLDAPVAGCPRLLETISTGE
jgi:hypothetical protein